MQFKFKTTFSGPFVFLHARAVNDNSTDSARTHAYVGYIDGVAFWGRGPARDPMTPIAWAVSHALRIRNLRNWLPPVFWLRGKKGFEKRLIGHPLTRTTRYHPLEASPVWKSLRKSYDNKEFLIDRWRGRDPWIEEIMREIRAGLKALAATAKQPERPIPAAPVPTMERDQVGWPSVWNDDG